MVFKWESEKGKFKRNMNISAARKLEWLEDMRQLLSHLPKKTLAIRKKMKE